MKKSNPLKAFILIVLAVLLGVGLVVTSERWALRSGPPSDESKKHQYLLDKAQRNGSVEVFIGLYPEHVIEASLGASLVRDLNDPISPMQKQVLADLSSYNVRVLSGGDTWGNLIRAVVDKAALEYLISSPYVESIAENGLSEVPMTNITPITFPLTLYTPLASPQPPSILQ